MIDATTLALARAANDCYNPTTVPWAIGELTTWQVYKSVIPSPLDPANQHPCYAFEGTNNGLQWIIDLSAEEVVLWDHPTMGPVHLGMACSALAAAEAIAADLRALGWPSYYITGHSKGAGECQIAAAFLTMLGHAPLAMVMLEPPLVAGPALDKLLALTDCRWTQTFNAAGNDIVTTVPPWPNFNQRGTLIRLQVPDSYDIGTKHRSPAVLAALEAM